MALGVLKGMSVAPQVKVKLIGFSTPVGSCDPRRLIVLAIKVSQGRLHERSPEYYLREYPERLVGEWVSKAWGFPSVLEHVVFTFLIEGISRVCSHQLVRHRIASYAQESQRYSESYAKRVIERIVQRYEELRSLPKSEAIRRFLEVADPRELIEVASEAFVIPPVGEGEAQSMARSFLEALARYYQLVESGMRLEDARFALPQAIKTRMLVTMNLRELIHVACLRLSPKAQWEIREVVKKMVEEAKKVVPEIDTLLEKMCREVE